MCVYCEGKESIYYDKSGVIREIYIEEDKTMTVGHMGDDEFSVNIKISNCPMCGKKLK